MLTTLTAGLCYATVGVHPCSAKQFDSFPGGPSALISALGELAKTSKAAGYTVAFGEIGLDYDRLFLTPKEQQLKYFEAQLDLAVEIQLPLFLHSRAASEDFERLLVARLPNLPKKGLVHSFTGTVEEMKRMVELGLDVGVNGCSMKTEENIEVVRQIPLESLQIETDGPWVSFITIFFCHLNFLIFALVRNAAKPRFCEVSERCATASESCEEGEMEQRYDGERKKRVRNNTTCCLCNSKD